MEFDEFDRHHHASFASTAHDGLDFSTELDDADFDELNDVQVKTTSLHITTVPESPELTGTTQESVLPPVPPKPAPPKIAPKPQLPPPKHTEPVAQEHHVVPPAGEATAALALPPKPAPRTFSPKPANGATAVSADKPVVAEKAVNGAAEKPAAEAAAASQDEEHAVPAKRSPAVPRARPGSQVILSMQLPSIGSSSPPQADGPVGGRRVTNNNSSSHLPIAQRPVSMFIPGSKDAPAIVPPRIEAIVGESTSTLLSENDGTEGHDSEVTVESLGTADQSGWMTKYSGALGTKKTWRKRYFVLKGKDLFFFIQPTEKSVGVLRMQGYKIDPADQETGKPNSFQATKGATKLHYFTTETAEEKEGWMHQLYIASVANTDDYSRQGPNPVAKAAKTSPGKKKEDFASSKSPSAARLAGSGTTSATPSPPAQRKSAIFPETTTITSGISQQPTDLEVSVMKNPDQPLGLDIRVNLTEGTIISKIIPGGCAEHSHFKPGDRITKIDGTGINGWTKEQVVNKMRTLTGEVNFSVTRI